MTKAYLRLGNPIYMDQAAINHWLKRYDTLHATFSQCKAEATRMTDDLRGAGHDGIVATDWDSPQGHSTIVVFPKIGGK